jgi:hypothetical protein
MALTVGVNSWVTVAEADTYLADKWGASDWATLTNPQKESLLISAYRWIQSKMDYSISPASTSAAVKAAQIELAWYIYNYWAEHEKRDALYSQGVRNFKISKWAEKLEQSKLPTLVEDLLKDELENTGGYFPQFTRELE